MIRTLQPFHVVRYAFQGRPRASNRAHPLTELVSTPQPSASVMDVGKLSISMHGNPRCCLAWTQESQVVGIAAARPRSGPGTWELSHLIVKQGYERGSADLLRSLAQDVAERGGERVFARLLRRDRLVEEAGRCGFIPCGHESLFAGTGRPGQAVGRSEGIRPATPADGYSLFRLYNASTPSTSRLAIGATFEQWSAAREKGRGRPREFVYEIDDVVRGSVRTLQRAGTGAFLLTVHPNYETDTGSLVDFALDRLNGAKRVYCLAQAHQMILQRLLEQRGYEVRSDYVPLVRSMVAPAKETSPRAVTVAST